MNPIIQPFNDPNNSEVADNSVPQVPTSDSVPNPPAPVSEPDTTSNYDPPAFHNPLATPYSERTGNLPDLAAPQPVAETILPLPDNVTEPTQPIQPPLAERASELPVSEIAQTPTPAPVRLAPEPKSDDWHAAINSQTAATAPFSGAIPNISPNISSQAGSFGATPKKSRKSSRIVVLIGIVMALAIGGAGYYWLKSHPVSKSTPTPTASNVGNSQRDTKVVQTVSGLTKLETPCYVLQLPSTPAVNLNADCKLDASYGEQKISSIVVSTFRDFDLVSPSGSDNNANQRFDSDKFLQDLIKNTTTGKTVVSKENIKVGNLDAQKIVVSDADKPQTQVAYVYIVLPETDQQFNEKKIIAFIVTAAYNDEYSRKSFDQALKLWYWK